MHVSILGAGALGRAYAAALCRAKCEVTLIKRTQPAGRSRFTARRHGLLSRRDVVEVNTSPHVPACDLVVVAVRAENVDDALLDSLGGHQGPVVVLTPMLARATTELWATLPHCVPAMPNVLSSWEGDQLDYWAPPLTQTLLDASSKHDPLVGDFARRVRRGGIGVRFGENVTDVSRATTIAFMPLQLAAVAEPRVTRWHENSAFIRRVAAGLRTSRRLALDVAPPDLGIRIGTWVLSSPLALRLFSRVALRVWPPAARYLASHFGEKLKDQTARFERELRELVAEARLPSASAEQLLGLAAPTRHDGE